MPSKNPPSFSCSHISRAEAWRVVEDTARILGFPADEIKLRRIGGTAPRSRKIIVWVLREVANVPFPQMGVLFSKHHTTLLHAYQVWLKELEELPSARSEAQRILEAVSVAHAERARLRSTKIRASAFPLVYLGHVSGEEEALANIEPAPPEETVSWSSVPVPKSFFAEQNARVLAHMRAALEQESRERTRG